MPSEEELRQEFDQIPFSLSRLIEEVLAVAGAQARGRGLELVREIDPVIPDRLIGNPLRLKQVFINLIENAIKFTEEGQVQIKIEKAAAPTSDWSELEFSVSDTGTGIPKEMLSRIFGGSGPGLAITKNLVERMGGVIWAESLPGEGSTFRFRMVLKQVEKTGPG